MKSASLLRSIAAAALAQIPAIALAGDLPAVTPVGPGDVLSVGTGLVLVVGAILVTGWLYSRTQKLRGVQGGLIRVVASQALGTRERVILLQVADQQLLIGMTTSQVQTLHVFDQPIAVPDAPGPGFAERLRAAMKGEGK